MKNFSSFNLERRAGLVLLRLCSEDSTNRLPRDLVLSLTRVLRQLAHENQPVVIAGSERFFSAGADLSEIAALAGPTAFEFAKVGQELMQTLDDFPAPVAAAISGYCMGGGLDLALASGYRIASPHAVFGHRGAALGLMTGWGGTQRLPRLIGKGRALQMFLAAEKVNATEALRIGLVDKISEDPITEAELFVIERIARRLPASL